MKIGKVIQVLLVWFAIMVVLAVVWDAVMGLNEEEPLRLKSTPSLRTPDFRRHANTNYSRFKKR